MDSRIRNSHRYAVAHGFVSGYSTMEEGRVADNQLEYQSVLMPTGHAEHRHVKRRDLRGNPEFGNIRDMFRAAHRYAQGHGFETGFPAFEQGKDVDNDVVYGINLLRNSVARVRSVPASDLGDPDFGDPKEMMIAAHRFARTQPGMISGFPLFEQGLNGGVLHYGISLIDSSATFRHILADALAIFERFSFDPSITGEQRNRLCERHCFAISRITPCGNLSGGQKEELRKAYRKNIKHGSSTDPGVNAYVPTSGSDARKRININFGNLFPLGNDEIAQTLIHEMVHCAGCGSCDHPARRDGTDMPGDGGAYYGTFIGPVTPSVRAEGT